MNFKKILDLQVFYQSNFSIVLYGVLSTLQILFRGGVHFKFPRTSRDKVLKLVVVDIMLENKKVTSQQFDNCSGKVLRKI